MLTFSLLLSEPTAFAGGGTYFEEAGRVYRPSRGVGVLHSALVRHAGYPISSGVRHVLLRPRTRCTPAPCTFHAVQG